MSYVFPPAPVVSVPVVGSGERFPVHRIYCVGRNYEEHAKEMGFTGREPPFFFQKNPDNLVLSDGAGATLPYPARSSPRRAAASSSAMTGGVSVSFLPCHSCMGKATCFQAMCHECLSRTSS